jgi:drug/metabolite transporter (DMT)-like permease
MIILYLIFGSGAYLFNALAINEKNATMASLLEISYPLFIILITLIFLHQIHLNAAGLAGAVLILAGCVLVVFSRGD